MVRLGACLNMAARLFCKSPNNYIILKSNSNNRFSRHFLKQIHNDTIVVEKVRQTTLIGINRPSKRNCINHETAKLLLSAVKTFDEDDTSVAAVLYGIGGNFCSGYDLDEISNKKSALIDITEEIKKTPGMGPMGPTFYQATKPIIAAIEGFAVAGGLELALWCDMRVVDETACLGVLNRRFGVPLIDGGTVRLPAIVGMGRAMELILTGKRIDGREAYNIGLANECTDTGTAVGKAVNIAQSLKKFPQACLRRDKRLIYEAVYGSTSLKQALENEFSNITPEILQEANLGARKFQEGAGKHGSSTLDSYEAVVGDLNVELDK